MLIRRFVRQPLLPSGTWDRRRWKPSSHCSTSWSMIGSRGSAAVPPTLWAGSSHVPTPPAPRGFLRDTEITTKRLSAAALANIGPPAAAAVPELCLSLADPDVEVRRNAALALGRIGPKARDAVPVLIRALQAHEPDEVRL